MRVVTLVFVFVFMFVHGADAPGRHRRAASDQPATGNL